MIFRDDGDSTLPNSGNDAVVNDKTLNDCWDSNITSSVNGMFSEVFSAAEKYLSGLELFSSQDRGAAGQTTGALYDKPIEGSLSTSDSFGGGNIGGSEFLPSERQQPKANNAGYGALTLKESSGPATSVGLTEEEPLEPNDSFSRGNIGSSEFLTANRRSKTNNTGYGLASTSEEPSEPSTSTKLTNAVSDPIEQPIGRPLHRYCTRIGKSGIIRKIVHNE